MPTPFNRMTAIALLVCGSFVALPSIASACRVKIPQGNYRETLLSIRRADNVMLVTVVSVTRRPRQDKMRRRSGNRYLQPYEYVVVYKVNKVWRGKDRKSVTLVMRPPWCYPVYRFVAGSRFLVFFDEGQPLVGDYRPTLPEKKIGEAALRALRDFASGKARGPHATPLPSDLKPARHPQWRPSSRRQQELLRQQARWLGIWSGELSPVGNKDSVDKKNKATPWPFLIVVERLERTGGSLVLSWAARAGLKAGWYRLKFKLQGNQILVVGRLPYSQRHLNLNLVLQPTGRVSVRQVDIGRARPCATVTGTLYWVSDGYGELWRLKKARKGAPQPAADPRAAPICVGGK